jgi:ATP-binding cassette, subfamily B, bacterial
MNSSRLRLNKLLRLNLDESVTRQKIKPGTVRRIVPYARPYHWRLAVLLTATAVDAIITAGSPLLLAVLIDVGIGERRIAVVAALAGGLAGLAVVDAMAIYIQGWMSGRIGEGLVYDLRTRVFDHVQRQSLAFFSRAQTGSLVSRLNTDVVGAQDAITTLLSRTVSTLLTFVLIMASIFYLSWQVSVATVGLMVFFIWPARAIGGRVQRLAREQMQLNAEMGSLMNERFNVSGALLSKLYGRPDEESKSFGTRAARVRDIGVLTNVYGQLVGIFGGILTALTTALIFGLGGVLVIDGTLKVGALVALVTLVLRLFGPVGQMANMQIVVMRALVSFDRVFEVMDLEPLVIEREDAYSPTIAGSDGVSAPDIEFDHVSFSYPLSSRVLIPTLESIALRKPEGDEVAEVLKGVSFRAPAGQLTALVGPSGAGKTTITHLVPRLYDATAGTVRVGGHDVRDLTLKSLLDRIGVVTQDAHLFHDTLRANLCYARPGTTEQELIEACESAQIWNTVSALPDGLDTVVGERGYRMSGGERQRVALARLLIKSPSVVVLDEATAHLDSESELLVQRALKTALAGRTALVIAHRLSTIRDADQILVIDSGQIVERGTHAELLAAGGLYAELCRTQFGQPGKNGAESSSASRWTAADAAPAKRRQ